MMKKQKFNQEFDQLIKKYESNPDPNMGVVLTEHVCSMIDLPEKEQNEALERIEQVIRQSKRDITTNATTTNTNSTIPAMDDASERLVELLKSNFNRRQVISLIKGWFLALCADDMNTMNQFSEQLANQFKFTSTENHQIKDMVSLIDSVSLNIVKTTPSQYQALQEAFEHNSKRFSLEGAYEMISDVHSIHREDKSQNSILLCHCTRNSNSIDKILKQGFIKGSGGRLGAAIYLSDTIEKCLAYSTQTGLKDGGRYGVVIVAETWLGKVRETRANISGCPVGFDSVFANGQLGSTNFKTVEFRDGTTSKITVGPFAKKVDEKPTAFGHNEYAIYDPTRTNVRFVLLFKERIMGETIPVSTFVPEDTVRTDGDGQTGLGNDDFKLHQQWIDIMRGLVKRLGTLQLQDGSDSDSVKRVSRTIEQLREPDIMKTLKKVL